MTFQALALHRHFPIRLLTWRLERYPFVIPLEKRLETTAYNPLTIDQVFYPYQLVWIPNNLPSLLWWKLSQFECTCFVISLVWLYVSYVILWSHSLNSSSNIFCITERFAVCMLHNDARRLIPKKANILIKRLAWVSALVWSTESKSTESKYRVNIYYW